MADDADALRVHFGPVRQGLPAVGGHIGMKRQRLAACLTYFGFPRIAARGADGQRDEAAPGQLQAEVTQRLLRVKAGTRFRFIVDDEDGGKWPLAFRNHQPAFACLLRRDFQTDAILGKVIAARFGKNLNLGLFQNSRPRTHQAIPGVQNLLAPPRPVGGRFNAGPIVKQ